jgi:hypothetical protein
MKQHILIIDDDTCECIKICIDTAEGVGDAKVEMIAYGVTRTEIWNGEPGCDGAHHSGTYLTLDHYICPGCGELRDNSNPSEAKCITCGRCGVCAPDSGGGMYEDCDECGGRGRS